MPRKEKLKIEKVIEALKANNGFLTYAAKDLGVDYHTVNNYIKRHESVRQAQQEITERMLDISENSLFKSIAGGNVDDAKWLLTKKGQSRGYCDSRVNVSGEMSIDSKVTLAPMLVPLTDEAKQLGTDFLKALQKENVNADNSR